MFVRNEQHLQKSMFGSINSLPEKILKRLEEGVEKRTDDTKAMGECPTLGRKSAADRAVANRTGRPAAVDPVLTYSTPS